MPAPAQQIPTMPAQQVTAPVAPAPPVAPVVAQPAPQVEAPAPNAPISPQQATPIAQVYANQAASPMPTANFGGMPTAMPVGGAAAGIPSYAVPVSHHDIRALLSVIFGVLGIVGALIIPIIGVALGITSIVLGTLSRRHVKGLSIAGIVFGILALLAGLATWAIVIASNTSAVHKSIGSSASSTATVAYDTPCYKIMVPKGYKTTGSDSCGVTAYNGATLATSTEMLKVASGYVAGLNESNFNDVAKKAVDADFAQNLSDYTVTKSGLDTFAGNSAYVIEAHKGSKNVTEAAVLHESSEGDNLFVIGRAKFNGSASIHDLESVWSWK